MSPWFWSTLALALLLGLLLGYLAWGLWAVRQVERLSMIEAEPEPEPMRPRRLEPDWEP